MNFKLKNFGKILDADIKFDGITVICGNNNTGKSTIGKAVFSFYNSLFDYKSKILEQEKEAIQNFLGPGSSNLFFEEALDDFLKKRQGPFKAEELKKFLSDNGGYISSDPFNIFGSVNVKYKLSELKPVIELLNLPEVELLNKSVFRYFSNIMNYQIKNVLSASASKSFIKAEFNDGKYTDEITFYKDKCNCNITTPVKHCAYYINSPYVLDNLNIPYPYDFIIGNPMEKSVIDAINSMQSKINGNSMTNIFDSVKSEKELEKVRGILKKAYKGDTIVDKGKYYYSEKGHSYDIRNISAGLKSFALIERMLETGVLKRKDVLILDEPEIHLHSRWQNIYAELIVELQKTFDLTVLIVTHSFQFLEALNFYMMTGEISDRGNYYIPVEDDKGFILKNDADNLQKMKASLASGTFELSDLEYEYDMRDTDD